MATEKYIKDTYFENGRYGRNKIVINATKDEMNNNPLKVINDNMGNILSLHNENVKDFKFLTNYSKGEQDILSKVRANGDTKINNKHTTNYAWEFVEFKKGFYFGKPLKYVNNQDETNNEMSYLLKYNNDVNKPSKDLIKATNLLTTGLAYTFTNFKKKEVNLEEESPYNYIVLDNENTFCVYSSDIENTLLFSCYISNIKDNNKSQYNVYTIYYDYKSIIVKQNGGKYEIISGVNTEMIDNPITEYELNQYRMGCYECVMSAFNSMNTIRSNQIDTQEEFVNGYLTFENVDFEFIQKNINSMRDMKAFVVSTNDPNKPAKVNYLQMGNEISSTNEMYNDIEQRTYDIVGVPMPTSNTGQGVSGEAQVYGGGWENAQSIASVDTTYIKQFEKEDLKKFIYISREKNNSKTKSLSASDIDIKYTINKSNNMLVKSQTFKYLRDLGVPFEQSFEISELTDDPYTLSYLCEQNLISEEERAMMLEVKKQELLNKVNNKTNESGIDSQE